MGVKMDTSGGVRKAPSAIRGWVTVRRGALGPLPDQAEQRYSPIITWDWPFVLADAFLNCDQHIQVGTGMPLPDVRTHNPHRRCTQPAGNMHGLDRGYPELGRLIGGIERIIYQATFPAGSLNLKGKDISEVCVCTGNGPASACLAYARFAPGVSLGFGDSLQVRFELTYTVPVLTVGEEGNEDEDEQEDKEIIDILNGG
jgi:hypothetical protein